MRIGGTSRVPYGFAVTLAAVFVACTTAHAASPRCFGAAARDPQKPCTNPALKLTVTPKPDDAVLEASAACAPVASKVAPARCSFGTAKRDARQTVALIGDSHAVHWRAAETPKDGKRKMVSFEEALRGSEEFDEEYRRDWLSEAG